VAKPIIYYDMSLGPLNFVMNMWRITPWDETSCFSILRHTFKDVASNTVVTLFNVVNFEEGTLQIATTNTALLQLNKDYDWYVEVNDGTPMKRI